MASVKSVLVVATMDFELLQILRRAVTDWYAARGDLEGNPFDAYARHIGIGERTFKRRLKGEERFMDDELVRICIDLKNDSLKERLQARYDWGKK